MEIGLDHYLILAALLFAIGVAGVVIRRNALILLMSVELMLNAVNLTLIAAGRYTGHLEAHSMAIFVMAVAAAEAALTAEGSRLEELETAVYNAKDAFRNDETAYKSVVAELKWQIFNYEREASVKAPAEVAETR